MFQLMQAASPQFVKALGNSWWFAVGDSCDGQFDPDKPYHYGHGAYLGHMLPGYFFVIWGTWWALSVIVQYIKSRANRRQYVSRAWFSWPTKPDCMAKIPLEPLLKVILPFIGINGELWAGHESWRRLYLDNGIFNTDNLNDWQHSCMYLAFMLSGVIDLIGTRRPVPPGMEQAFLALAFVVEGVLLGFHLKGPDFEVIIHKLLVYTIVGCAGAILAEAAYPHNVLLSMARSFFVILQGTWFMQIAVMMYNVPYEKQWHPCYMGSTMFAPVVFATHMLCIFFAMAIALVFFEWMYEKITGTSAVGSVPGPRYHKVSAEEEVRIGHDPNLTMEMAPVLKIRE